MPAVLTPVRVGAISFAVGAVLSRADIPVLCADLAELLLRGPAGEVVICDVAAVTEPDLVTVEALARLRVTAGRHGRRLVVNGAGPQLLQLVRLFGLSEVLVQAGGQAEQRKQAGGVEEIGDRRDPPG